MKNTKVRSEAIQAAARALLVERSIPLDVSVPYRELAPILAARTGCDISTAKRHILKAQRIARGDYTKQWGGVRDGAGRPKEDRDAQED